MQDKNTRPFLKWAGNKYRCLGNILQHLPQATRFIEPFTGSGAIFVNTEYSQYILAEVNQDLINLFQQLQKEGPKFIEFCADYFTKNNNQETQYYRMREEFNQCTEPKQRSALFLYLNRHGYNGLCRYNSRGIYNVPFGKYTAPYFPHNEMLHFFAKSQRAQFICSDFQQIMEQAMLGDVIYCDPPYAPLEQASNFTTYTNHSFGEQEQILLTKMALACAHRGVTVLISNHDTPFTREQYHNAEIHAFKVARTISSQTNNRLPADELLAIFR